MGFRILNKEDISISMGDLDREAAAFWNKEVQERQYANPTPAFVNEKGLEGIELTRATFEYLRHCQNNWIDMIGWVIHHPQTNYTDGWNNIKCSLWTVQSQSLYEQLYSEDEQLTLHIEVIKQYLKPYFDLIDHWAAKGYTPYQVKD